MEFDPTSAVPVETASLDFDTSSAMPAEDSLASDAQKQIQDYTDGKIDLDQDHLTKLNEIASAGQGPWGKLASGIEGVAMHPIKTGEAIGEAIVGGTKAVYGAAKNVASVVADPLANMQVVPNMAAGLTKGAIDIVPAATNIAIGLGNLLAPDEAASSNAMGQAVERTANKASKGVAETLGANLESPEAKVAAFAPQALIPLGAEEKLASTVAKVADTVVEKGTQIAGKALEKTATVGKAAAPAAIAGAEAYSGHPLGALFTLLAGYGGTGWPLMRRLRHAIIDKQFDKIGDVGKALANAEDGQTIIEGLQQSLGAESTRLRSQIDDIAKSHADKVADAYKLGPDGQPLYTADELSGPAKKIRLAEDQIKSLQDRNDSLGRYANLNQILSDATKFGIRTGLNLGVAGATGAALVGPSAPPGQEGEAARQGFGMGAALGTLGAYSASKRQKLGLVREKLLEGKTLSEDHPLYEQHQANMESLSPVEQDYVNSFSALANKQGGKPIVVLNPDEMVAAIKLEGTDVAQAPNGFEGKDVIYANKDALASGVIPHEFTHGTGLDEHPEVVSAIREMQDNPELKSKLGEAIDRYNSDLQTNLPGVKLSVESQPREIAAALGADMLTSLPPEAIYGGRSGSQIIGKWMKDTFGSQKDSTTTQYGFPVTPEMKSAMEDALFDLGKSAESRPKENLSDVSLQPENPPVEAKVETPPEVTMASQAIEAMGYKKDKSLKMAQAAHDDLSGGTEEQIVTKALQKQANPIPIGETPPKPISNQTLADIHLGIEKGDITKPEDLAKFNLMPSGDNKIVGPAIKNEKYGDVIAGKIGQTHQDLYDRMGIDRSAPGMIDGFITEDGQFLTRREATDRLQQNKPLQSEDLVQEKPKRPLMGDLNTPEAPVARPDLSGVSLQRKALPDAFKEEGPIIDTSLPPEEQRFQELFHKDESTLNPSQTKELNDLTFKVFKKYGSIENFESKYPAKGQQLMPSTPPEYKKITDQYGLRYEGEQEGYKSIPGKHLFSDPSARGTTFSVPFGASPEQLLAKMKAKRELMNPGDKMSLMPSQTRTPEFQKWFGDSKVANDKGEPIPVYHGTTHSFGSFDQGRVNYENDFGRGFYFSNSPEDVAANYSTVGPDLTNRIERRTENLFDDTRQMKSSEIATSMNLSKDEAKIVAGTWKYDSPKYRQRREILKRIATRELTEHQGATIKAYLKLENPLELGGKNEPVWEFDWNDDVSWGTLEKFKEGLLSSLQEFDPHVDGDKIFHEAYEKVGVDGKASEYINAIKESSELVDVTGSNGDSAGNEIIRQAIESMGYDGIIDRQVNKRFGSEKKFGKPMAGMGPDTIHYIAFRPEQVKSAIGNKGTFDPSNPDIAFMPSASPKAIKEAAIRTKDGKIYTDSMHFGAYLQALDAKKKDGTYIPYSMGINDTEQGFVTNEGEFLDTKASLQRALDTKQITKSSYKEAADHYSAGEMKPDYGKLESINFSRAKKKTLKSLSDLPSLK